MVNLDEMVKRLLTAKGLTQGKEAAKILGISPADLSNRKKRGTLLPLLIEWAVKEKVNLHWFITGEDSCNIIAKKRDLAFYEELEEWARETGRSDNIQWMRNQIESFFPKFKEWKEEREGKGNHETDTQAYKVA